MKAQGLFLFSLAAISAATICIPAQARTENQHSICVEGYGEWLGQKIVKFDESHAFTCKRFVDLEEIQDKIRSGAYENYDQAANALVSIFRTNRINEELKKYSLVPDHFTVLNVSSYLNNKDRVGQTIEKRLIKSETLNIMLNSATNDLMQDYRDLHRLDGQLKTQISGAIETGATPDQIARLKARRAKVADLVNQLQVIAQDQMAQYNMQLSPASFDRLLESAVGQEELKLLVVGRNVDRAIAIVQQRMKTAQAQKADVVAYEGDLALLNKVAAAALTSYRKTIEDTFIPTLDRTISDAQMMATNNHLSEQNASINRQIQFLAGQYIQVLEKRAKDLQERHDSLRPQFDILAQNYGTASLANDVMGTIMLSQETAMNIDNFLKIGNLSNDGADGMQITQKALAQIEDNLFGNK